MTFFPWLRKKIPGRWGASQRQERQKLLAVLREVYRHQSENVASFTHHAEQMYYPHLRDQLLLIVEEEQSHLQWLKQQIGALGGDVPQPSVSPMRGANTWENLRLDLEEEQKDDETFLRGLRIAERLDRDTADGLARLRHDEQKHRQQFLDLLQKSEPDAVAVPLPHSQEVKRQKRIWLAQEKMAWLEQRRSLWEADGKLIPWAEWLARREYEWTANELPNRELHWALQYTTQTATDIRVPRVSEKL